MNIRVLKEEQEIKNLNKFAVKSRFSAGREVYEQECDIRTSFQRDRDRIVHTKAFRRLMYKTQVFISPEGDHYRTRLTHTFEVSQIARSISNALFLNENLTEAIALGHDLGHTPFGHLGEDVLRKIMTKKFCHNKQSVRVVQKLEKNGKGINLTKEVLDGMLNHRGKGNPNTLEGKVVQISDKIAYVNHDIDDAIRAGLLTLEELPKEPLKLLGNTSAKRINFLIKNIVENSINVNDIIMEKYVKDSLYDLRAFLFEKLYNNETLKQEREYCEKIIESLFYYYDKNFDKLPKEFLERYEKNDKETVICDYIAGMTDRFAKNKYIEIKDKII